MNYKNEKRLQVINYIVKNLDYSDGLSKEFIGKLVYLSNKLFLLKYGCTITGDKFIAMPRGTTCSETLAIMDKENKYINDKEAIKSFERQYECSERPHSKKVHTIFPTSNLENNFARLSDKEEEIIDIVIRRFGKMRDTEISAYTHQFLEWKNSKNSIDKSLDIDMNDVFRDETFWEDEELSKYLNKEYRNVPQMIYNGDID